MDPAKVKEMVHTYDKARANYYNYHTCQKWGQFSNYNLAINSGYITEEEGANLIVEYVNTRTYKWGNTMKKKIRWSRLRLKKRISRELPAAAKAALAILGVGFVAGTTLVIGMDRIMKKIFVNEDWPDEEWSNDDWAEEELEN